MSGDSERWQRKISRLAEKQGGVCFWCAGKMVMFDPLKRGVKKMHKATPRNLATFDHVYNRLGKTRQQGVAFHPGVIACQTCNSARGAFDVIMHTRGHDIDVIWDFSRADIPIGRGSPLKTGQGAGSNPARRTIPVKFKNGKKPIQCKPITIEVRCLRWE